MQSTPFNARVLVMTSDKYNWCLQPFCHLFNTFWSSLQPVLVAGFTPPTFPKPSNFDFFQIDKDNYPATRWSDGLIRVLESIPDRFIVLMLEDYWLCRGVDVRGVSACLDYMKEHGPDNILRFDLTTDRLYAGGMFDVESYGCYDVIETPVDTPYQMSLQAGLWNTKLLRQLLEPGKSAWEVEIHTAPPAEMRVLGTRQWPVRFVNAYYQGKLNWSQINKLPKEHLETVKNMIPPEQREEKEDVHE